MVEQREGLTPPGLDQFFKMYKKSRELGLLIIEIIAKTFLFLENCCLPNFHG